MADQADARLEGDQETWPRPRLFKCHEREWFVFQRSAARQHNPGATGFRVCLGIGREPIVLSFVPTEKAARNAQPFLRLAMYGRQFPKGPRIIGFTLIMNS